MFQRVPTIPLIAFASHPRALSLGTLALLTRRAHLECPAPRPLGTIAAGGVNGDWYADGKAQG